MQNKWGWAKNESLAIIASFNQNHFGPVIFKQWNHTPQVSSEMLSVANPTLKLLFIAFNLLES